MGRDEVAAAAHVAGVADDGQGREAALQFDGQVPHRRVAVELAIDAGEAAVDGAEALDAGVVDAQQGTRPQLDVGVHGVLDEDGHIDTFQGVGDGLYAEGVGRGAGTNPQDVDAGGERCLDVLGRGDLGGGEHTRLGLDALHPGQGLDAFALEATGLRARLPYSGPEHADAVLGQFACRAHHLFLGLGRARTGNDQWTFVFNARKGKG